MLYPLQMVSDPPTPRATWHSALVEKDQKAHEHMAVVAHATEPEILRRKVDGLAAEVTVLRAAVDRRSQLLREQSLALAERDARILILERDLRGRRSWLDLPIRALRRARSLAGRLLRRGSPQR